MSQFSTINAIDGNQYLVNSAGNVSTASSAGTSFDEVYNTQTQTKSLEDIFQSVSTEYGVPIKLLKAVAQAESDFDTNAVSGCGASGIMQLMPETAAGLGVEDVFDAEQNITGGAKMLAYLLSDYGGNTTLALAAYNAGSGAVAKYGGVPPYEETKNYIAKINTILEGGLEADTTSISIEKNASVTSASATTSGTTSSSKASANSAIKNPIKIVDEQDQATEAFSYENYLKFLEVYQDMLTSVFENSTSKKDEETETQQSEQQNFYQLQQAKFNSRAISLLDVL